MFAAFAPANNFCMSESIFLVVSLNFPLAIVFVVSSAMRGRPAHLLHPAPIKNALLLWVRRSSRSLSAVAKVKSLSGDRSSSCVLSDAGGCSASMLFLR